MCQCLRVDPGMASSTKLVRHRKLIQHTQAFSHDILYSGSPCSCIHPFMERRFDVHGHRIHQPFRQQPAQKKGLSSIGIQLDGKSIGTQLPQAVFQVWLESRLSTSDYHSIYHGTTLQQAQAHTLPRLRAWRIAGNQSRIMAKGTTKVAPLGKNDCARSAWKIHQAERMKPRHLHSSSPAWEFGTSAVP